MLTKTKIALATVLVAGTTSLAAAQGYDPNLANRYPALADPIATAQPVSAHQNRTLHSAPVGLHQGRNVQGRNVRLNTPRSYGPSQSYSPSQDEFTIDAHDHASSPYAGGGF